MCKVIGRCSFTRLNCHLRQSLLQLGKQSAEALTVGNVAVSHADAAPLQYISGLIQTCMLALQVLKGVKTCMSVKKKNRTEVSTTYGRPRSYKRSRY